MGYCRFICNLVFDAVILILTNVFHMKQKERKKKMNIKKINSLISDEYFHTSHTPNTTTTTSHSNLKITPDKWGNFEVKFEVTEETSSKNIRENDDGDVFEITTTITEKREILCLFVPLEEEKFKWFVLKEATSTVDVAEEEHQLV